VFTEKIEICHCEENKPSEEVETFGRLKILLLNLIKAFLYAFLAK